jgi:hypothetical protein
MAPTAKTIRFRPDIAISVHKVAVERKITVSKTRVTDLKLEGSSTERSVAGLLSPHLPLEDFYGLRDSISRNALSDDIPIHCRTSPR